MKFNLKYLILPLSIMACIDNYEVNAMEGAYYNEDENQENNEQKFNNIDKIISLKKKN